MRYRKPDNFNIDNTPKTVYVLLSQGVPCTRVNAGNNQGTPAFLSSGKKYAAVILLALAAFILTGQTKLYAVSAYSLNEKGNKAFEEKKFDEALQSYVDAQVKEPNSPELNFNIGNIYQKQNKFDEAITQYNKTIEGTTNNEIASNSLYNIGVSQFRQAEQIESTGDLKKAVEKLQESMGSFQQAMKKNPQDKDFKINHEQAKRKWKELLQKMKDQQKNQQNQQGQDQQQKDEQKQDQNQQGQQQQQQQQAQGGQDDKNKDEQKKEGSQGEQENKDGEKEKQQAAQQGQDDKDKKEQQAQQAQKQDGDKDKEQQGQQQQAAQAAEKKEGELSEEDANRILSLIPDDNKETYKQLNRRSQGGNYEKSKNW